jgi:hypothetical protein
LRRLARSSRRSFLHGALAAGIGLPWLESITCTARAQAAARPRFIVMFSPNGTLYERWVPTGTEAAFSLSPILSPLEPHRSDLVVVAGLDQQGGGGDGHQNGIGGMLTGNVLLPGRFAGTGSSPAGWADGPSVDQSVADVFAAGLPFRSLELGVQTGAADNFGRMIYRARNRPLPPREDPSAVFDDVFAALSLGPEARAERRARRTSILDHVRADLTRLSVEVSLADRRQLEQHLTYLREVEARLDAQSERPPACRVPERPPSALPDNDAFPDIGELQLDLLVLALACGQTRVASLQWSRSVSEVRFTWLGVTEGHHALSHMPDADSAALDKLTRINQWYAERYARLIEKLKAYAEGSGTLFDQSLLLWCNELGRGNTHSRKRAPYVLAGSAGGALRTGRFLQYSGDIPHNDLLVSILNVLGVPSTTFGKAEWCTGALPGLL